MKYRLLGQTGLYVSELCLGTMTYGSAGFWKVMGGLDQKAVTAQVKYAFERGVNFIDTANVYSLGQSEELVGQAIRKLGLPRDELVIATKATGVMNDLPNGLGQSRYHLMNEVNASLNRLQLDHIDLYQLHGLDPLTPLEEALETLNDLVRSGKVRYIGITTSHGRDHEEFLKVMHSEPLDFAQFSYNIEDRTAERELLPVAAERGIATMINRPYQRGALFGKSRGKDLPGLAAELDCSSWGQFYLKFILGHPAVTCIIPATASLNHMVDNMRANFGPVPDEQQRAEMLRLFEQL